MDSIGPINQELHLTAANTMYKQFSG